MFSLREVRSRFILMLAVSVLLRGLLAGTLELGNDEAYYTIYAQKLQWNYFDHPPVIALLIRLTTLGGWLRGEFFIRLGALVCSAAGTVLIYSITQKVSDRKSAFIAALLFTFSFYSSVISGVFILPDAPELLFWLISIRLLISILDNPAAAGGWIWFGLTTGLTIMSKVSGVFLWCGLFCYALFYNRTLLKNPKLYFSLLITAACVSPIVIWNIDHQFITLNYHSSRVGFLNRKLQWDSLLQNLLGSLFYNNPLQVLAISGMVLTVRRRTLTRRDALFLWLGVPLIVCVLFISLFNDTLPHWSGPAFTTLLVPTACFLSGKTERFTKRFFRWSGGMFFLVVAGAMGYFFFLPLATRPNESTHVGKGDISLDMTGWRDFQGQFLKLYRSDVRSHQMNAGAIVLSDYWFPAAHLDYYAVEPAGLKLFVAGPLNDIHQFGWKNAATQLPNDGTDAYFIYPSNYFGPASARLRAGFSGRLDSVLIPQYRAGVLVRNFVILRMRGAIRDSLEKQIIRIAF